MLRLFCAFNPGSVYYFCNQAKACFLIMRLKTTSLFILLVCFAITVLSQETILERFQANAKNGQVLLTWTIEQGSTCNGIRITRSADSLKFIEIGEIEGVCGSTFEPVNYSFTDTYPLANRRNFYRLELGDVGSSEIISIEAIVLNNEGYIVFPNPTVNNTRIYFTNTRLQRAELKLFSINGSLGHQLFSENEFFDIDLSSFNAGMYVFLIYTQDSSSPLSGKLIVQ